MDRISLVAWWAIVLGVTELKTTERLNNNSNNKDMKIKVFRILSTHLLPPIMLLSKPG